MNLSSPTTLGLLGTLVATIVALVAAYRLLPKFFWRIAICVVPLMVGGVIVGNATYRSIHGLPGLTFKKGVDIAGGTILVYEVDASKFANGEVPANTGADLAAALKRRIDPADLYNISIRPVGNRRVEIILPAGSGREAQNEQNDWDKLLAEVTAKWPPPEGGKYTAPVGKRNELANEFQKFFPDKKADEVNAFIDEVYGKSDQKRNFTAEQIEEKKNLITQIGSLEFRILANETDDREIFEKAKEMFKEAKTNPSIKRALENAALYHKPPPRPHPNGETFQVKLSNGTLPVSYSWVELGKLERQDAGPWQQPDDRPALEGCRGGAQGREADGPSRHASVAVQPGGAESQEPCIRRSQQGD